MPEWRATVTTVGTWDRAVSGQAHLRTARRGEFAVESEYVADSSSACDHNSHRVDEGICTFIVSAMPMTGLVLDTRFTSCSTATQELPSTRPSAPAASSCPASWLNRSKFPDYLLGGQHPARVGAPHTTFLGVMLVLQLHQYGGEALQEIRVSARHSAET